MDQEAEQVLIMLMLEVLERHIKVMLEDQDNIQEHILEEEEGAV